MERIAAIVLASVMLTACGGDGTNPFIQDTTVTDPTTPTDPTNPIADGRLPPGTVSPKPNAGIHRSEKRGEVAGEDYGNGFATNVKYDAKNGTFDIDGLGFDGANIYKRGVNVSSLGPAHSAYAVYEAAALYPDSITGTPINQFTHRAIYGADAAGTVEFAIVRTGAYVGYGFGGFVYQRNGSVVLPATGQATYSGDYAAVRDFKNRGGLESADGTIRGDIDFNDFNAANGLRGDAVKAAVTERHIYDINGKDITESVLDALTVEYGIKYAKLPVLTFKIGPGVMDDNGEITGDAFSTLGTPDGDKIYENGKYYAVMSGNHTDADTSDDKIVGVIVTESTEDKRFKNVTVRETGGFIVARQ